MRIKRPETSVILLPQNIMKMRMGAQALHVELALRRGRGLVQKSISRFGSGVRFQPNVSEDAGAWMFSTHQSKL